LAILLLEVVVLVVGGLAWGWLNLLIGLLFPIGVMGIDAVISRVKFPPFHPSWWMRRYHTRSQVIIKDSVVLQVSILIFLLCSAVAVGWLFGVKLNKTASEAGENIFVVLLMTVAFVGVAIACWTSLPQVVAIAEAREAAEHLFTVAQDGILVVDDRGIIQQANPATESFFGVNPSELRGNHLNKWLTALVYYPEEWTKRSEQTLLRNGKNKILEVSISDRPHQNFQEYVVILHDITQRKQAEQILRYSEAQLRQEAKHLASQLIHSEKMSSLGQLVAGVAHEINNPVNFIYGNITHANQYIEDLLKILQLYQQNYPNPVIEIKKETEAIDLDFVIADLPKLLTSMTVGAERITEIVLSLRNFSRLDETEMKAVNIHEGIDNTLLILEHRLKAKPNSLTIDIIKEYGDLPLVECYAGQLNQVFMNLLANAIDALEEAVENGEWGVNKAALSTPQIKIHTQLNSENQVVISIADNGIGIPENVQKHLFEPFFTTKPVGKGTGLGLSISYQIVTQKHLGQLQCISTQGQGTEFVVVIPLNQEAI
jgi:PAS domain S-box-containing protein